MNPFRTRIVVEGIFAAFLVAGGVLWLFFTSSEKRGEMGGEMGQVGERDTEKVDGGMAQTGTGDTDGDGLLDWEERLRGTDAENPDTDGDETLDGEEVQLGRDPQKAGQDDVLRVEKLRSVFPTAPLSSPSFLKGQKGGAENQKVF